MSAPFSFQLRYSRKLLCAIGLAHLLPLVCIGAAGVPGWVRGVVMGGVLASALWQRRAVQKSRDLRIEWGNSGEVWLRAPARDAQVEILTDSIDLGWLIVLHWREQNSQRSGRAALTREVLTSEQWRMLRRRLRWNQPGVE